MLDRNILPAPASRSPWALLRAELSAGPTSRLAQFLLGLAAVLALTCLYLWQASTISAIEVGTAGMEHDLAVLERETAALMVQLSQWEAPGFIESKAQEQGLKPGAPPIYVHLEGSEKALVSKTTQPADQEPLWGRITGWMSRIAYSGVAGLQ